jgi:hypothetical protein
VGEGQELPGDPLSALAAAAAQMHELFLAWVGAGFTRAEALQMIIAVLTKAQPPGGQS